MGPDPQHVHHFWGVSPAVDAARVARRPGGGPLRALDVGPGDVRHALATLARGWRPGGGPVHWVIWEATPEVLARHLLLLAVALDAALPARERAERFMELHSNALLTERTEEYLEVQAVALERLVAEYDPREAPASPLAALVDLRHLKFQDRDRLVDVFKGWRRANEVDVAACREARLRQLYQDRFDFRKNVVDWDYHMRLLEAGVDGVAKDATTTHLIHFKHFREWRLKGIAQEVRDSVYSAPNRTLASTALGRAKEFKDRDMKDRGRSVASYAFWGDVINSPWHSFGTQVWDERDRDHFHHLRNKQFLSNSMDLAQHNAETLLFELEEGKERPKGYGPGDDDDFAGREERSGALEEIAEGDGEGEGDGDGEDGAGAACEEAPGDLAGTLKILERVKALDATVSFFTGDFSKIVLKNKLRLEYDLVLVSNRHAQLVAEDMAHMTHAGTVFVAENAKYALGFTEEQAREFETKLDALAQGGWERGRCAALSSAHVLYARKA